MRGVLHVAALGLLAAVATSVAAASDVHDLKKTTFDSFVREHDLVLAEFFAPWCGHCKALAPEYEEAATTLAAKNIALAKIDCTEEADLCSQHGIEGYPTLKIFRGPDNATPYAGQRKAPAIVSYMTKQALPAVSTVTAATLEEFKTADKVVLVAFLAAGDAASNTTFSAVAESLRDSYLFGASSDAALAKQEGVSPPGIALYKSFDEGRDTFEGAAFTADAIEAFAKTAATPLIGEVGPETYSTYMSAGVPLGYIFAETAEERSRYASELKATAQKHKGAINLATIDAGAFGQHAQNLNLEVGAWPAFAIQDTVKNLKFPMPGAASGQALDVSAVSAFVESFIAGSVAPSVKSEPIPTEQASGAAHVVVAHSYADVVMDPSRDVLLEFYAPWCGHCKSLAPKYDELARLFAPHAARVTIAKVDATLNDVPDEIQGFPTIKLYPAGSKDKVAVDYTGPRTVEDLAAFVRDRGANGVDPYADDGSDDADMRDAPAGDAMASSAAAWIKAAGGAKTEDMQHQAPAATATANVVSRAAEAVQSVVDAVVGEDVEDHDEL